MSDLAARVATRFDRVPAGTWFGTYDPEKLNLDLGFNGRSQSTQQVFEIRMVTDDKTGATWLQLDGKNCTIEGLSALGRFTVPLSDFLFSATQYDREVWVHGKKNIEPLESLLSARGDTVSAEKLRINFPKLFTPPAPQQEPQPQMAPPARKGLFRRRK